MKPQLTDDQIDKFAGFNHLGILRHEEVKLMIVDLRAYKSQVEAMQEAIRQAVEGINIEHPRNLQIHLMLFETLQQVKGDT